MGDVARAFWPVVMTLRVTQGDESVPMPPATRSLTVAAPLGAHTAPNHVFNGAATVK